MKHRSFAVGRTIDMNRQQFVVMEGAGFAAMFPGVTTPTEPHLGGVALTVADIGKTRSVLTDAGVAFRNWGEHEVWVRPADAGGGVVAFVDEGSPL